MLLSSLNVACLYSARKLGMLVLWIRLPSLPSRYHSGPSQCRLTAISNPLWTQELRASSHMSAGESL